MRGDNRVGAVVLASAGAVALCLSLAGCLNTASGHVSKTRSSNTASASPAPTDTDTATATPTPVPSSGQAITTTCAQLFTAQQVYNYNPNVVVNSAYSPAAGSLAAQAVADLGRACGWINETSSEQLTIAVAAPNATDLASARAAAAGNGGLSSFNGQDSSNFQTSGGTGTLQVFAGSLWLILSSPDFGTADDAEPTAKVILANLGAQ